MNKYDVIDDLDKELMIKRVKDIVREGDLIHRGDGLLSPVSGGFVIGAQASDVAYPVYRVYELKESIQ